MGRDSPKFSHGVWHSMDTQVRNLSQSEFIRDGCMLPTAMAIHGNDLMMALALGRFFNQVIYTVVDGRGGPRGVLSIDHKKDAMTGKGITEFKASIVGNGFHMPKMKLNLMRVGSRNEEEADYVIMTGVTRTLAMLSSPLRVKRSWQSEIDYYNLNTIISLMILIILYLFFRITMKIHISLNIASNIGQANVYLV